MASDTAHHISKLNKSVRLANYPGHQRAKVFFIPAHSSQTFKNFTQTSQQNSSSADRWNTRICFDKGGKKTQSKTKPKLFFFFFTKEEIIRVSRCDQNIHWQHKHLDCIIILCSLWCYQPNAAPGCNQATHSQLQETAHVLLSRALNIHLHQWTLHLQAISLNIPGALWCACEWHLGG